MAARFEYVEQCEAELTGIIPRIEFEDQLSRADGKAATSMSVRALTPGLSGAAVFQVSRIGTQGRLPAWVVKVARDPALIIAERRNYEERISGRFNGAPQLVDLGSSRMLVMQFGGALAEFRPVSLREGYAKASSEALEALMARLVVTINPLHQQGPDTISFVRRMSLLVGLDEKLTNLGLDHEAKLLMAAWTKVQSGQDDFPHFQTTAHGDLNAGNVLFEPGERASYPVIIDFASVMRSKDNSWHEEGWHLPFWDYAKIERDLQTRMFLKEALIEGLAIADIVTTVTKLNGATGLAHPRSPAVSKLVKTTTALRAAIQDLYSPELYHGCYRVVLANAMMSVLFRSVPDTDIPADTQRRIAANAAIALLDDPKGPLVENSKEPDTLTDSQSSKARANAMIAALSDDEKALIKRLFAYEGRCKIAAVRGEKECLWVPGPIMDMQWGWERTSEEVASGKAKGSKEDRERWLAVVEDLIEGGLMEQLEQQPKGQARFYQLTRMGNRAAVLVNSMVDEL